MLTGRSFRDPIGHLSRAHDAGSLLPSIILFSKGVLIISFPIDLVLFCIFWFHLYEYSKIVYPSLLTVSVVLAWHDMAYWNCLIPRASFHINTMVSFRIDI